MLALHYRDEENLTIGEIGRRLGRAEPTVKAYLHDPSQANKRPSDKSGSLVHVRVGLDLTRWLPAQER